VIEINTVNKCSKKEEIYLFSDSDEIQDSLKGAFNQINEEFHDHLDAINDNTNEIQSNYEYMCELDSKIDKLGERMDEIVMLLRQNNVGLLDEKPTYNIQPLNNKEKEIFMTLYTMEAEFGEISYIDLSRKLAIPSSLVQAYVTNIFGKGVPIQKRFKHDKVYLTIDPEFRDYQARENIVGISEVITRKVQF